MQYVYVLRCADGSLYTGWTTDLLRRLSAHQSGKGAKYTRAHGPVELVYSEAYATKSEAMSREAAIKALPRTRKLALLAPWIAAQQWIGAAGRACIDLQEALRRGLADVVRADATGVLLKLRSDAVYLLAASGQEQAERLLEGVPQGPSVCAHGAHCAAAAARVLGLRPREECHLLAYFLPEPPERDKTLKIARLGAEYGPVVAREYHGAEGEGYLLARVIAGQMYGAFCGDRLAGFIGTQTDGSMGLLEVLPDYRRQGLAEKLERFALAAGVVQGQTPFCYVPAENALSLELQKSLGLVLCDKKIYWMD